MVVVATVDTTESVVGALRSVVRQSAFGTSRVVPTFLRRVLKTLAFGALERLRRWRIRWFAPA